MGVLRCGKLNANGSAQKQAPILHIQGAGGT